MHERIIFVENNMESIKNYLVITINQYMLRENWKKNIILRE